MNYKWTVLTVTTVGVLMAGIDSRIVVIGLPQVASALGADAEQAIWFTQAYVLGSTVALLFIGRVSDMFGRVKVYALGFGIFTAGSLLTSLSQSPGQLIAFRFVQGLGSAVLFSNSAAIITDATPTNELGFSLGINQVAFRAGAMAGLTVSGLLLSLSDWRALFYINVPIGIFGTIWARKRLREISSPERNAPMDWQGFFYFTSCISSFLLALTYAAYGRVALNDILFLLPFSIAFLVLFIHRERSFNHPLLDMRLLGIREFTGGVVAQLLNSLSWGAVLLLLSLYLQLVKGMTPLHAGLAILPFDISFLAVGPLSGRLSDRYGHTPFTTSGLAIMSVSLYLFSTLGVGSSYLQVASYLVIFGVGIGMFSSPNMSSIMGSVPSHRRGVASGFRATFFNIGFTLSFNVAILVMTFTIPYSLITSIISSPNPSSIPGVDRALFATALDRAYLWLAAINAVAIFPSVMRGKRLNNSVTVQEMSVA